MENPKTLGQNKHTLLETVFSRALVTEGMV